MSVIEIDGAVRRYRQGSGVGPIHLTLERGEVVSIVGPSGCGKTTLLELVAGLQLPEEGCVYANGVRVTGPSPERQVVFQDGALFPWLSVADNVAYGLRARRVERSVIEVRTMAALEAVNLVHAAELRPHQLSGGMKQRAALARALVVDPGAVLLDEPFSALDEPTRSMLQRDVADLLSRRRTTCLLITHSVEEACLLSDRVVVLTGPPGRIAGIVPIDVARPRTRGAISAAVREVGALLLAQVHTNGKGDYRQPRLDGGWLTRHMG